METAALLALALKLLDNAPELISLGEKGVAYFTDSKAKIAALAKQPGVTIAEIDTLDESISARHIKILAEAAKD